jgi:surface antigen
MLKLRRMRTTVVLALLFTGPSAYALNIDFIRGAPMTLFTEDDRLVFEAAVLQAVSDNADNEMMSWQSTDTDSRGEVTPLDSKTVDGLTCRSTRIVNHAKGKDGAGVYELCQQSNGDWRIVSRVKSR